MTELGVLTDVTHTYKALWEVASVDIRKLSAEQKKQTHALETVFGPGIATGFTGLAGFLTNCRRVVDGSSAENVKETLLPVLTTWQDSIGPGLSVENWRPTFTEAGVQVLETALHYQRQLGGSEGVVNASLRELISEALVECQGESLSEIEIEARKVLIRLLRAMDAGDVKGIRDAAVTLAGMAAVEKKPVSRIKRFGAIGIAALSLMGNAASIYSVSDEFLQEERAAIEVVISGPVGELTVGGPGSVGELNAGDLASDGSADSE